MVLRLALCVGINNYDPDSGVSSLNGCVNDSYVITKMLEKANFKVTLLNDDKAIKTQILEHLQKMIETLNQSNEEGYLVYWNSSHGYQVPNWDLDSDDEHDQLDEAICTYDTDPNDPLTDDVIKETFVKLKNKKVNVFFGSDSCYSQSLHKSVGGFHNVITDQTALAKVEVQPRVWFAPPETFARPDLRRSILDLYGRPTPKPYFTEINQFINIKDDYIKNDMQFIFMSACKDDEYSWDAWFNEVFAYHGAMTYCFVDIVMKAWNDKKPITYKEAFRNMCSEIKDRKFQQNPTMEYYRNMEDQYVFGYNPE